jgi:hypothetical protein
MEKGASRRGAQESEKAEAVILRPPEIRLTDDKKN